MTRTWTPLKEYKEILFDEYNGIARITINRPRYRNAFTPLTVAEMGDALRECRERPEICVVVLTRCQRNTALHRNSCSHLRGYWHEVPRVELECH